MCFGVHRSLPEYVIICNYICIRLNSFHMPRVIVFSRDSKRRVFGIEQLLTLYYSSRGLCQMDGCLTLKRDQRKKKKIDRFLDLQQGPIPKSIITTKGTVQIYRRFVTCEGTARSYTASAVEVPMRPSSAILSLFMVSAASRNCQRVFVTKTINHVQMTTRLTRLRLLGWGAVKANSEADNHKNNLL